MKTNSKWVWLAAGMMLPGAMWAQTGGGRLVAVVEVANPSEWERADEPVELELRELGVGPDSSEARQLMVRQGSFPLPSQTVDRDGDGRPEALRFVYSFAPGEKLRAEVREDPVAAAAQAYPKRTQAEISVKDGGQWVEEKYVGGTFRNVERLDPPAWHTDHNAYIRYEGPGWESDKVGYRFYLDWRNGFDIFAKKTPVMVLQEVGQDGFDSYHEEAAWGMDILKVGEAVGCGGYGWWDGEKVIRVSRTYNLSAEVAANGPVASGLRVNYEGWDYGKGKVDLRVGLAIGAGSRLTHVSLETSAYMTNLVAGIVKHPGTEVLQGPMEIPSASWTWLATWGQQTLFKDDLGMVVFFRKGDAFGVQEDALNHVVVLKPGEDRRVEYAFGAAWAGEPGGLATKEAFAAWCAQTAERLTVRPRVRLWTPAAALETTGDWTAEKVLGLTRRMAESERARRGNSLEYGHFDPEAGRPAQWTYTTGLFALAMDRVGVATGESQWQGYAEDIIGSFVAWDGKIVTYRKDEYNIDQVNSGKMLLRLAERTGEERYRKAADLLRAQLRDHPRTSEGGFWHKQIYPWQMWLDGLYMGAPFLAGYGLSMGEPAAVEDAVRQFVLAETHTRDAATGLLHHAWDEKREQPWADKVKGTSGQFWGRGLGWYAMALADMLELLPAEHPGRKDIAGILQRLAPALVRIQDEDTGTWWQILDQPGKTGNYREASATAMFVYALAKGANEGVLGREYAEAARRGYAGMVREFVRFEADGKVSLANVCQVAGLGYGRDGSYAYYMAEPVVSHDPKGVGPFLLAGVEVAKGLDLRK